LHCFRVITCFRRKWRILTLLAFIAPVGGDPLEFRHELWCQKTRVKGLSYGIIGVILRLAVLTEYRSVTDIHTHRQTDRRTDRHATTAYTALSITLRGKNALSQNKLGLHGLQLSVSIATTAANREMRILVQQLNTSISARRCSTKNRSYIALRNEYNYQAKGDNNAKNWGSLGG